MNYRRSWESICEQKQGNKGRVVRVQGSRGLVSGKERFVRALRQFLPPKELGASLTPAPETSAEAWLQYKIRQLEARQQWFMRLLWLVVVGLGVRLFGGDLGDVIKLLALF